MTDRLIECFREQDQTLRLACYDREVAPLATTSDKPAPLPDANTPAGATRPAEDSFGLQGSEVARQRDAQLKQTSEELKRLTATVTAISTRPRGELVFTLDNGQIWQQAEVQSYFPAKVGDAATISAGALGSFRLAISGRSTQVKRIR